MSEITEAPVQRDHNCRRRAFLIIAVVYGAAALAQILCWVFP